MYGNLKWERIAHDDSGDIETAWQDTYRAKIPGGWLVAIWATVDRDATGDKPKTVATPSSTTITAGPNIPNGYWGGGLTFVPDPKYKWEVTAYPKKAVAAGALASTDVPTSPSVSTRRPSGAASTKRRNGRTSWVEQGLTSPVREAIVDASRIAFDVSAESYDYTVTLAPAPAGPPWWRGTWRCRTDATQGPVQAKLYTASDGGIVLIGIWKEDGDLYWVTELS